MSYIPSSENNISIIIFILSILISDKKIRILNNMLIFYIYLKVKEIFI